MSQQVDSPIKGFTPDGAIPIYSRVKVTTAGHVDVAALADKEIGFAQVAATAAGKPEQMDVKLRTAQGTQKAIASEPIAVGAAVYTAAAGKVSDTAAVGSFLVGTALEAASADGDVIEILVNSHGDTAN